DGASAAALAGARALCGVAGLLFLFSAGAEAFGEEAFFVFVNGAECHASARPQGRVTARNAGTGTAATVGIAGAGGTFDLFKGELAGTRIFRVFHVGQRGKAGAIEKFGL